MSEANEVRGEISLELGGREFILRPSYQAISAIEAKTGRGLLALAREAGEGNLSLADTAITAVECIKAHGKHSGDDMMANYRAEKIAEMIFDSEGGHAACLGRIAVLLSLAVTGGYTASGELKAAKETASE